MKIFCSLYAKIFGWFWLTLTVGALLVVGVTFLTGAQPFGTRWMRLTQDMYAHTALDFYESGGAVALERYLAVLRESSGIEASLVNELGGDVLGRTLSDQAQPVLSSTKRTGRSSFRIYKVWTAATPVSFRGQRFVFVMRVNPLRFIDGTFSFPILRRVLLAMLVAGVFCLLLARHIVAPVRALQRAAQQLAAGDFSSRVSPALGARGDELGETATAFDVMADRLQLLLETRQELLAHISHELRSPLTRVSVSLELFLRGEMDAAGQMIQDIDRMNAMIGQILLLSRLDLQPVQPTSEPIEIEDLLKAIGRDAEFEAQNSGKTVSICVEGRPVIKGDPNLIRSCIENVIRNAIRHTEPNTKVVVTGKVANEGKFCRITIVDSGPGVPAAELSRLFEPFYRASAARDQGEVGTGLGLAIAKRIVQLHSGSIRAEVRGDDSGLKVVLQFPSI